MQIDILTLFPEMFTGPMNESIMWRAQDKKFLKLNIVDLRKFGLTKRLTVDDRPYGGGAGMIIRVDVIDSALQSLKNSKSQITNFKQISNPKSKIVLLDAAGEKFTQKKAYEYSQLDQLTLICGHYEGVDHRVNEYLIDEAVSIGDYVLTGGEIPAMVIADSVTRLIPNVIKPASLSEESFSQMENARLPDGQGKWKMENNTEYPQYTRPENYKGWKVPEILLGGNHAKIEAWRKQS